MSMLYTTGPYSAPQLESRLPTHSRPDQTDEKRYETPLIHWNMGESSAEQLLMEEEQNSSKPVGPCMIAPQNEPQNSEVLVAPELSADQQESSRPDGPFCTEDAMHDQQEVKTPDIPSVCTHTKQPTQLAYRGEGSETPPAIQPIFRLKDDIQDAKYTYISAND